MSRKDFEDDGRTIADMSGLDRPAMFLPRSPKKKATAGENRGENDRPWESTVTPQERRMTILAALKASILVALAYIVGLGAVILLLIWLWS